MDTMTRVRFTPLENVGETADLVFGIPPDTPEQRVVGIEVAGATDVAEIASLNSSQRALKMSCLPGITPEVKITFSQQGTNFPDWTFTSTGGVHETASAELVDLMADVAPVDLPLAERVLSIVRHVESSFTYGVRPVGLGDDQDSMPALTCDIHLGTCVDTHSYAVAAMRAAGIPAAYVSGLFFPEGQTVSEPGHCWFVIQAEGSPHHWDVSHFLKYNLGPVRPAFNPKPGTRFAMSIGRDIVFPTPAGAVTLPRLSGFNTLSGPTPGKKLQTRAEFINA